jgi:hypothetical protein
MALLDRAPGRRYARRFAFEDFKTHDLGTGPPQFRH